MQKLLTSYLLQYKKLTIPQVGTIRLVQHSAQLRIADKQIDPPTYSIEIGEEEEATDHQLSFFSAALEKGKEEAAEVLRIFGGEAKQKMAISGFEWEGIGTITHDTRTLSIPVKGLTAVAAEKIVRQDAGRTMLVGDRHMTSAQITDGKAAGNAKSKRSVFMIAGWILLVLSILAIVVVLYRGKFRVDAAGSKLPTVRLAAPSGDLLTV